MKPINDKEKLERKKHLHAFLTRPQIMWALGRKFDWGFTLLGNHCWPGEEGEEYKTRLFKTRQQARDSRATCNFKDARVVKVNVNIDIVQ